MESMPTVACSEAAPAEDASGRTRSAALSPVALYAYRRPVHLRRTLEKLRANPEASQTELFVFCDNARDAAAAEGVDAV